MELTLQETLVLYEAVLCYINSLNEELDTGTPYPDRKTVQEELRISNKLARKLKKNLPSFDL